MAESRNRDGFCSFWCRKGTGPERAVPAPAGLVGGSDARRRALGADAGAGLRGWRCIRRRRPVGLSRFAAGGGAALLGGVPFLAAESALDCPARFGHTWLGSGICPHGHSS